MSDELQATGSRQSDQPRRDENAADESDRDAAATQEEEAETEDDEDEDEEPILKYAKLTGNQAGVYRNGDSTSTFMVAGDKMVVGTHNGVVHVLSLPTFRIMTSPVRVHQASVTSVSVSPIPPPYIIASPERQDTRTALGALSPKGKASVTSSPQNTQRQLPLVANTSRNQIYIATSSMDGHVCILSLVNPNDKQRRNFARPINAVALSPDYKNDRTYLTGGLAGKLILTEGGKTGVTIDANTNSAASTTSGWLGSIGLGGDRGKDTALHSGEGSISAIRWSLSGKWVVWVNEEGIKVMRSHLKLGPEDSENAWKRIAHQAKPNVRAWEGMAGVWKGRCEWVDERKIETDNHAKVDEQPTGIMGSMVRSFAKPGPRSTVEKLVVGWGDMACVIHVIEGGKNAQGHKIPGSAEVIRKLKFEDCIISGISLFAPSQLAILAWRTRDDDERPIDGPVVTKNGTPRKGRSHRHVGLHPQLRLVNVATGSEDAVDDIPVSRSETLAAQDYHLATVYIPKPISKKATNSVDQKGGLEVLFDAAGGKYAARMFSSGASVMSGSSGGPGDIDENGKVGKVSSPESSVSGVTPTISMKMSRADAHPYVASNGLKLFIQSPYDCVLAVKRDLADHLAWSMEHQQYEAAWHLVDEHPEIIDVSTADQRSFDSRPSTPLLHAQGNGSLTDFFSDDTSTRVSSDQQNSTTPAQKEKQRIGDFWVHQLVSAGRWSEAGKVAGRVLVTSLQWADWIVTFAKSDQLDEITPWMPSTQTHPLPSSVYDDILKFYTKTNPPGLLVYIEEWDPELFDVGMVINAIESRIDELESGQVRTHDGAKGRDWKILMEVLAKLYLVDGRARDALRHYVQVQDAEAALRLIREEKMIDVVADDIPALLLLRVDQQMLVNAPVAELGEASFEVVQMLVEEAHHGTVSMNAVIEQLSRRGKPFRPFLFFYLRALWNGTEREADEPRYVYVRRIADGHALVEQQADLAVELFAEYDRDLLMTFLRANSAYNFDRAIAICRQKNYISELVHVLGKTGQTKDALFLIIDELDDVKQAIDFAKENPDLWDDLVEYSMDNRPKFICGLLEEVGTAGSPIDIVKRIPEGLRIEGLGEAVTKMMREHDIHYSITDGAARILRSEAAAGMDILRAGRRRGVRFEIAQNFESHDVTVSHDGANNVSTDIIPGTKSNKDKSDTERVQPGHCAGCRLGFHEEGKSLPLRHFHFLFKDY